MNLRNQTISAMAPAVLVVYNLYVYTPFNILKGNIAEVGISYASFLASFFIPALLFFIFLTGVGMILRQKAHRRYVSILFVLGILTWLQGNILVWKYGLLDGQGIDWTRGAWRGWVDGALWVMVLTLGVFLYERFYRVVPSVCASLLALQVAYMAFAGFQEPEIWKAKEIDVSPAPPKEIYGFSSQKNVIHLIMDAFQSDLFEEMVDQDPDYYAKSLEGFTFFKETTGAFATTFMSVPAFLSGQIYENNDLMKDFIKEILEGKTICNVLYDHGYTVDFVPLNTLYLHGHFSHSYLIPVPFGKDAKKHMLAKAAEMMDLALFRSAPHLLKPLIYNEQLWQIRRIFSKDDGYQFPQISHRVFLDELISNMFIQEKKPLYKFIHLVTTHPPNLMTDTCEYSGEVLPFTRENWLVQDKCAFDQILGFLEKIKTLGIYDRSLVIIHADTGAGLPAKMHERTEDISWQCSPKKVGNALPLLLIKPPNSRGALKFSSAHVMLSDIPNTIASILDLDESFPGKSAFDIDPNEQRKRRYHHYKWQNLNWQDDYFRCLEEYTIKGSALDCNSWTLEGIKLSPSLPDLFRTRKIDFGTDGASRFLIAGWGGNETWSKDGRTFCWGLGGSAALMLTLPKEMVELIGNIRTVGPMQITVKVDGKEVGVCSLENQRGWQKLFATIPSDEHRPDVSVVEFLFSRHMKTDERDHKPLAAMFESLSITEMAGRI